MMQNRPGIFYKAWTQEFDRWFAAPNSVLMEGKVNTPYFFETVFKFEESKKTHREPHYGRFLRLEEDKLVTMTWVTGPNGTKGAETIVEVELESLDEGTLLTLTHSGFLDKESKDQHEKAWPEVLKLLDKKYARNQES